MNVHGDGDSASAHPTKPVWKTVGGFKKLATEILDGTTQMTCCYQEDVQANPRRVRNSRSINATRFLHVTMDRHDRRRQVAKCPYALFKPISRNFNEGMMKTIYGLVVHITDGHGELDSVWGDFDRVQDRILSNGKPEPKKSAHFCINTKGDIWQFVDTSNRAWALDGSTHDSHWISVENIAKYGERLTDAQVMGCSMLLYWMNQLYSTPYRRAQRSSTQPII
jgi:hypothetical protein